MDRSSEDIQVKVEDGIFKTNIPAFSDQLLKNCFRSFLDQSEAYRKSHLQKNYGYAFDGYSYYGQKDSSNQAYDDLLETFVFSNFFPKEKYPKEFYHFLTTEWQQVLDVVSKTEEKIISAFNTLLLSKIYKSIGHMVSCNYYPAQKQFNHAAAENTRLSAHPDVSLITIFPFGIDGELEFETADGSWKSLPPFKHVVGFSGYLSELATDGAQKALNHRVRLSSNINKERFSFAFFSLPFPKQNIKLPSEKILTGKAYFKKYLQLFD
ncbi:MAG: 2OG-Fe(II) oxygenase family protein [Cyclobacteriaceae bacterium]